MPVAAVSGTVYSFLRFTGVGLDVEFVTVPPDPHWADVVLAMHMDGANTSTDFQDSAGKTVTANGNAQISNAQSKFGGTSAKFDGTGDYLSSPNNADFEFGTGDFTVESWVYIEANSILNGSSIRPAVIAAYGLQPTGNTGYWLLYLKGDGTTTGTGLEFNALIGGSVYMASADVSISQLAWHHVAASRAAGVTKLFLDGLELTLATDTLTTQSVSGMVGQPFTIGADLATDYTHPLNGYVDDLRITKGYARYTTSFTPATEAFPVTDVEGLMVDPTSQFAAGAVLNESIPITGVATGIGHVQGAVAASPYFSAAINAIVGAFGDVVASDIFYAIVDGAVQVQGEASGAISFVGDAVGSIPPVGRATGAMRFTGSGSGARGATGQVNTPIQFTSDTVGQHGRVGTVSGLMRFTGQASGARGVNGAGLGTIEFNALAEGHADVFPIGNVYALIGIGAQAFGPPAQAEICT